MAYEGYMMKFGDYIISASKFIKAGSFSAYLNMQDVDPFNDLEGYLHRDTVELKVLKVEFETPPLTDDVFWELMSNIRANYINARGKEGLITAYVAEVHDYVTQYGYLVDFQPPVYGNYDGMPRYNPIRMAFVGGVKRDA